MLHKPVCCDPRRRVVDGAPVRFGVLRLRVLDLLADSPISRSMQLMRESRAVRPDNLGIGEALPDAPQKHLLRSGQRCVRQYTQPAEAIIEREFAGTEGHDLKESTQNGDIL